MADVSTKSKTPRQVVSRMFRVHETSGKGMHRTITIQYEYDRQNKVLKYGASVFKREQPGEKFNKVGNLDTARVRFQKHPVVVNNFEDDGTLKDFHHSVRKQLYKHGVRGK